MVAGTLHLFKPKHPVGGFFFLCALAALCGERKVTCSEREKQTDRGKGNRLPSGEEPILGLRIITVSGRKVRDDFEFVQIDSETEGPHRCTTFLLSALLWLSCTCSILSYQRSHDDHCTCFRCSLL